MAHSRLEKAGTIFSRMTALIKTEAIPKNNIPIWYEIYQKFPPKEEPTYSRPKPQKALRNIFYKEDIVRVKFHQETRIRSIDLLSTKTTDTQIFLEKYSTYLKDGFSESEAFDKAMAGHQPPNVKKFDQPKREVLQQINDIEVETNT